MGVWTIFSFFLGFLPAFLIGGFAGVKLSEETELVPWTALGLGLVGGILGIIVFGYGIGSPMHHEVVRLETVTI